MGIRTLRTREPGGETWAPDKDPLVKVEVGPSPVPSALTSYASPADGSACPWARSGPAAILTL